MAVGDEDVVDVHQADAGAEKLALRALAAVDQYAVAAAPDEMSGSAALGARRRAGRAEEEHAQVHRAIVRAGGRRSGDARRDLDDARHQVALGQDGPRAAEEDVALLHATVVARRHQPERRRRRPIVIDRAALVEVHDGGVMRREEAQIPDGTHGSTHHWPATIWDPGMSLATRMRYTASRGSSPG